jgi:hypothetical protein
MVVQRIICITPHLTRHKEKRMAAMPSIQADLASQK